MGFIDVAGLGFHLPDGRELFADVDFRVGDGGCTALVGANGAGKTTLLRLIAGDLPVQDGAVTRDGGLGVMRQFIGSVRDDTTVAAFLLGLAPPSLQAAAARVERAELALMERDDETTQMRYAEALTAWGDVGGYEREVLHDEVTVAALGIPFERCQYREVRTLSGGEQKRLALEALLRGRDEVLLLDEPDNYLDVPGKRWLEQQLTTTRKTVLFVTHDREVLASVAGRVVTLEGGTTWTHGGGYATYAEARRHRHDRMDELRRRWDEKHKQLQDLVTTLRQKAANNADMASRYHAAVTRLEKFEADGPPPSRPPEQSVTMRLTGGRTGKRAVVCENLELTGLMKPFDCEIWYGDRVAVLGSNGSGKSHFLRLLAAGGSDPEAEHRPVGDVPVQPVAHTGMARLGARVRPGWFAQTHEHPELVGRTLLEILHRGDEHRDGLPREPASRALDRYELPEAAEQTFDTLSGGQQARLQILLLELSGVTLLLLDEPTDNLDVLSAEALEVALERFEGTVISVTHDRWFARRAGRFLVFGADGYVIESDEPVWDEQRVRRTR